LADKRERRRGSRADINRFIKKEGGETRIRIPVSYLLKLALAEVIGSQGDLPRPKIKVGIVLLSHFLNDNSSPETYSFYIVMERAKGSVGRETAREKANRSCSVSFW
jgi:hypothetical protein